MLNVHLRVNDAQTRQPTPVRLRVADAAGRSYPPLGRLAEFAIGRNEDVGGHVLLGQERWCYVDGSCEVPLPTGVPLSFSIAKGPEYTPIRQEITLGAGQMSLRFEIHRQANLQQSGWYSGDTRCHFLTPHAALLEAMAEDVAVVQLLATETTLLGYDGKTHAAIPNMVAFSGQQPALEKDGHFVAVNTLNTHPVLGSLALLHCHRAVFPLSFGGGATSDDWSLGDWCDQCHRKKGLVAWVDPFRFENGIAPEALADLVLGRIDAVECTAGSVRVGEWYQAWSAGLRFGLIGASAKDSNRIALGTMRTYAQLPPETPLSLAAWIEAVRAGRTLVTTGPLLTFTVEGQPAGTILNSSAESPPLRIQLSGSNLPAGARVEVLANGEQIAESTPGPGGSTACELDFRVQQPCWLAARCLAANLAQFAHTSPVFVSLNGMMPRSAAAAQRYHELIGGTIHWVNTVGRFDIPRRQSALLNLLEQSRQSLLAQSGP